MSENQNTAVVEGEVPTSLTMHGTVTCVACTAVGGALKRSDITFDKVTYQDKDEPGLLELKSRLGLTPDDMVQFPVMQARFADGTEKLLRMKNAGQMFDLVQRVRALYPAP